MSFDVDPRDRIIAALKGQIATYREQSVIDAIMLGDKDADNARLRAALREIVDHLHIALNQAEDSGILDAMDVAIRALEPKP